MANDIVAELDRWLSGTGGPGTSVDDIVGLLTRARLEIVALRHIADHKKLREFKNEARADALEAAARYFEHTDPEPRVAAAIRALKER